MGNPNGISDLNERLSQTKVSSTRHEKFSRFISNNNLIGLRLLLGTITSGITKLFLLFLTGL